MKLENVVALVTGGASGLGAGTAARFVASGTRVLIFDRDDLGADVAARLGDNARFLAGDVTSEVDVQAALDFTLAEFGPINVLVNCAGIGLAIRTTSSRGPHPLSLFETVIRVNLIGTFNVIRLAATLMAANAPNESGRTGRYH